MFKSEKAKTLFASYFIIALDNFGFGLVFVLFAPLILDPSYGMVAASTSAGTKNFLLALLFIGFPLTQFIGAPLFGDLADNFGRKRSLYLTILGTIIGYVLSGVAIVYHSLAWLFVSRLITGFFSGNLSLCLASVADLSPDEKVRAKNYGIVTVVLGVSWPIAMLVAGYMSDPSISPWFSPQMPFWITALLSLLGLIVIKYFFTETHPGKQKIRINILKSLIEVKNAIKIKRVRPFLLVIFFWTFGWILSVQWYAAYSIERFNTSPGHIAWGLVIQGIFWVFGGAIINPLLHRKFNSLQVAIFAFCNTVIFLALCYIPSHFLYFSILYWIAALTSSVCMSNALNLISISSPLKIQGKAMGMGQSMISLGSIFVPILGGTLGNVELKIFYLISALLVLFGLVVLLFKSRKVRA